MGKGTKKKTKKSRQKTGGKKPLWEGILLFITVLAGAGASLLYGQTVTETAVVAVLAGAGFGCVLFVRELSLEEGSLLYDNASHPLRSVCIYLLSLSASILFPLLPTGGWLYLVIFVALALFSNRITGISAGCLLLMMSVLLKGSGSTTFFIYFVAGLVGILVFSRIDEAFQIWPPLVIALSVQMVCLCVQDILLTDVPLSAQMFIIPALNLLACFILLLILLKYFSFFILHKNRDLYMDINDPEFPLLVKLKDFSIQEYYHAVHTAYLCDRLAKKLHLKESLVKACGYYHRIGLIRGENSWENIRDIVNEHHFPQEMQTILEEYVKENREIVSPETVVLLFCDTVISSITYLFSKEPEMDLDAEVIIETIFKKKQESGILNQSNITMKQLYEMKHILVEEQSYYDFLR